MTKIKQCLIIAAGMGSRIAATGEVKPLVRLNGQPLIHHVIATIHRAGIDSFTFVLGYQAERIAPSVENFCRTADISCEIVINEEWKRANGLSVLKAEPGLREPFLLTMCDHIYPTALIERVLGQGLGGDALRLAVDRRISGNPLVDLDDVTRVQTDGDRILGIGKTLTQYNAFDTGVFLAGPELFSALRSSISAGEESLSGGVRWLAASGRAGVIDIGALPWLDVDDQAALNKAEAFFGPQTAGRTESFSTGAES